MSNTNHKRMGRWRWIAGSAALVMTAQIAGMALANSTASAAIPNPVYQQTLAYQGLNSPNDVVYATDGLFTAPDFTGTFVTDTGNNRVLALPTGSTRQITLPFQGLNQPRGLTVVYSADIRNRRLIAAVAVTDTTHNRIVVLPTTYNAMAGALIFGTQFTLPMTGLAYPSSVSAFTYEDNTVAYFVADTGNNRIEEICSNPSLTMDCATMYGPGQTTLAFQGLNQPRGVASALTPFTLTSPSSGFPTVAASDTNDNRFVGLTNNTPPQYIANLQGLNQPSGLSGLDDCNQSWGADTNDNRIVGGSGFETIAPFQGLNRPRGVDSAGLGGLVYAADTGNNRIVSISETAVGCD